MSSSVQPASQTKIHPTAVVDPNAQIGQGAEVGPYSVIGPDVQIGDRTWVGPRVVIDGLTTIGSECEVFQFASLGSKPQDLKYRGESSTVVIGNRNKIREYVTIQPGTKGGQMTTRVGDNNLFMANSHVGHDCNVGNNNVFANSVALAGHVTIFDNAIIGGLVGIHQFVRIGSYAMLSAGSMVGADLPPYCIGQGDRCHLRGINLIGLERAGFPAEDVNAIKKAYRALFSTVGHLKEKIEALSPELAQMPVVKHMLEFMAGSERGVLNPERSEKSD